MAYYSDPGLDINEYKFTRPPTDLQTFQVLHTGESDDALPKAAARA